MHTYLHYTLPSAVTIANFVFQLSSLLSTRHALDVRPTVRSIVRLRIRLSVRPPVPVCLSAGLRVCATGISHAGRPPAHGGRNNDVAPWYYAHAADDAAAAVYRVVRKVRDDQLINKSY